MSRSFNTYDQYLSHQARRTALTRLAVSALVIGLIPPTFKMAIMPSVNGCRALCFEIGLLVLLVVDAVIVRRWIAVALKTYSGLTAAQQQRLDTECLDKTSVGQDPGLIAPRPQDP